MTLTRTIWTATGPRGVRFDPTLIGAAYYVLFAVVIALFQGATVAMWLVFHWALFLPDFPHLRTRSKMGLGAQTGPEGLQIRPTANPA